MGGREIGQRLRLVRDGWNDQVHQFEPVDFEPLVFPHQCPWIRPVDKLIGPRVNVHHGEGACRGGHDRTG